MFDITIERHGSPHGPIHYWCGYREHHYARAAIGSAAAIVRGECPDRSITYALDDVIAEDGSIPLVRNGEPYATVRIVETDVLRRDTPIWGALKGGKTHAIMGYVGDDLATGRCGRMLQLSALTLTSMADDLDEQADICDTCIQRGALLDHFRIKAGHVGPPVRKTLPV